MYFPFAQYHTVTTPHFHRVMKHADFNNQPWGRVTADSGRWLWWSEPPIRAPAINVYGSVLWSQHKNGCKACAHFSPSCAQRAESRLLSHVSQDSWKHQTLAFLILEVFKVIGPRGTKPLYYLFSPVNSISFTQEHIWFLCLSVKLWAKVFCVAGQKLKFSQDGSSFCT